MLGAGLRWREVDVVRTYANYAFQAAMVPTRYAAARALARYPDLARLVVEYFQVRFAPAEDHDSRPEQREANLARTRTAIAAALEQVQTLSEDRPIRRLFGLIGATVRTNYYRHGGADPTARSGGVPYISIKIRAADVEELRSSRLLFEIFVHSSRMEGIHLRGAPISRGGIRWSDRLDDFRTEVLGLVRTQMVKNAVIVPGGSKGGFITKRTFTDRETTAREVEEALALLERDLGVRIGIDEDMPMVERGDQSYLAG